MRGSQKRAAIAGAARTVFLEHGFVGTTVDAIAAEAGASKRTIYAHFDDKEALFRAAIASTIEPMQRALSGGIDQAIRNDPRESLRSVARALATIIVKPETVRLRRMIIAEAERFPDVAAHWYALGPAETIEKLTAFLQTLDTALDLPDPKRAAEQMLWLVVSPTLNRLMFLPSGRTVSAAELRRDADAAFNTFWMAFARRPSPSQGG